MRSFFYSIGKFSELPYRIKMLRRITEARKGNYSYESAPRERVRKRTIYYNDGKNGYHACIDGHLTTVYNPGMRLMPLPVIQLTMKFR